MIGQNNIDEKKGHVWGVSGGNPLWEKREGEGRI